MPVRPARESGVLSAAEVRWRLDCADGVLAAVGAEIADRAHRALVERVAREQLSADDAVAATLAQHGVTARDSGHDVTDWDDYLIPGTTTLRNRLTDSLNPFGIVDVDRFRMLELRLSHIRIVQTVADFPLGDFDYDHMKTIHRRLFGDLYEWAGHERVGPTTAVIRFAPDALNFEPGDPAAPFVKYEYFSGPQIAEAAAVQYSLLASLARRTDLSRAETIDLFAEYGGEIQTMHAFRDGNVRASCVYAIFFAEAVGYPVDPSVFLMGRELRERLMHARLHNQSSGTHGAYFDTLNLAMVAERQAGQSAATRL